MRRRESPGGRNPQQRKAISLQGPMVVSRQSAGKVVVGTVAVVGGAVRTAEGFLFPPPLVPQLNPADFDLPSMIDLPDLKPGVQIYNADCMPGDVYVKMSGYATCRETCEASLPTGVCVDESQRKLDTPAAACRCALKSVRPPPSTSTPTGFTTDMEIFEDPTRLPGCYQVDRGGFHSFNSLKSQPIGCDADRGGNRIEFGQTSRLCVCRSMPRVPQGPANLVI